MVIVLQSCIIIVMESSVQLQQSRSDFKRLLLEGALPPKMQTKLRYLQASLSGGEVDQRLAEGLPQFERISLSMMNIDTKISLFNSIVRCLAGRELVVYLTGVKAGIKPEGSSSSSTKCYVSFDSEAFRVHKDKLAKQLLQIFPTDKLMVSKIYRKDKGKYSFAIARQQVKFRLKFEEEGLCARVHGQLLRVIREKRSMKAALAERQSQIQKESDDQLEDQGVNTGQLMVEQERQFLRSLMDRVERTGLSDTSAFVLQRNTELGKIMVEKGKGQVRLLMFLQGCSVEGLLESYAQLASWNLQVESFRIVNCIRRNNYLAHLKLKKQGVFGLGSQREAWLVMSYVWDCKCLRKEGKLNGVKEGPERHYLLISSVSGPPQAEVSGVSMNVQQVIELSEVQGKPGCVFLNLSSIMDFKVWGYLQSSLDLNLKFLNDIPAIALLCRERAMLKSRRQLFQFKACACTEKAQSKLTVERRMSAAGSQIGSLRKQSMGSESQFQIQLSSGPKRVDTLSWPLKQVLQLIDQHNKLMRNERFVELVKQRVFQRYYLRERFTQHCNQQPYIDSNYRLRSRDNFLGLGSRWKITSGDDFVFIDEEQLKMQKGVLKLIVKQITSNLMAGKSIMSMSLPVEIFDDFSALEGFAKIFGFVPPFMAKAVETVKIPEQIKYVAAAFMFMFACEPKVNKPFNPILGQTMEASIGGIPIYFEQTSHHPPVSTFYMKTPEFQIFGNIDITVEMGLNSAHSRMPAPMFVRMHNTQTEYLVKFADLQVGGIMFGERTMRLSGKGFVLQPRSGVYLQYSIGKQRKGIYEYKEKIRGADLAGGVFQITPEASQRLLAWDRKKSVEGIRTEEVVRRYSLLTGKWFGQLSFDGVVYKSLKSGPFPLQLERSSLLLPSDCTFRLDIAYRRWRNYARSNEEKEVLENIQRADRRLREKHFAPAH